ncbi:hypothetical protein EVAR_17669_1 [Eumeta japonica]|uniref:Uncharacterized protein n=1 Tax=Eumeta variegata TaxID=151549 RepID=A0A4C1UT14_EUMVA|nr:hypothetical protein EVAR_17669_1 [Eumeta japonica]
MTYGQYEEQSSREQRTQTHLMDYRKIIITLLSAYIHRDICTKAIAFSEAERSGGSTRLRPKEMSESEDADTKHTHPKRWPDLDWGRTAAEVRARRPARPVISNYLQKHHTDTLDERGISGRTLKGPLASNAKLGMVKILKRQRAVQLHKPMRRPPVDASVSPLTNRPYDRLLRQRQRIPFQFRVTYEANLCSSNANGLIYRVIEPQD